MTPRIAICLPSWNACPFLQERLATIFRQTFRNWELFVYDSDSNDGSWELIQRLAKNEERMSIMQGPRRGLYPAWNECIRHTSGEFVYIATSDDTMADDFLEKMLSALDRHNDCELAHCPLSIIDADGRGVTDQAWPDCTVFSLGIGQLVREPHMRRAPCDGLLHLTGRHVYFSITQLLIRRSLFSKIGDFPEKWGSRSDFNWEMKAGLVANIVHVPDTWATWRVHPKQASSTLEIDSIDYSQKTEEMIEDAVSACAPYLPSAVVAALNSWLLDISKEMRTYYRGLRKRRHSAIRRRLFQSSQLLGGTKAVRSEIVGRFLGRTKWPDRFPAEMRLWLESKGLPSVALEKAAIYWQ
jgi:glycosyltransferase involved in cell wall biosynthesis